MLTVIYARKSRGTIEELDSQISICKDYCNKNSYEIAEVFSEIVSSQDFEREQYKALKEYIKKYTHVRVDKYHYVLDLEKADIIKQIFTDIASGISTKEVVNKLEQINFRSNNNKRTGTREIRNIVKNEVYYKNIPQIVTREQWLEANQQLRSLSNRGKRSYPLSNKIICSHCGTSLIIGFKAEVSDNKEKLSKLNNLYLMDNISQEQLTEQSTEIKDRINLLELKQQRLEGYSLFKIAEEIQDRIVKLEEMQNNVNINDLVILVDYVQYYRDTAGLSVKTIFKEL